MIHTLRGPPAAEGVYEAMHMFPARLFLPLMLGLLLYSGGCGGVSFLVTPVAGTRALGEVELQRDGLFAADKIAVIDVDGVLRNDRGGTVLGLWESQNPVATLREKLDKAARDRSVRAVVLRINSPGGGVTASDLMHAEVERFKRRTGKPVVASLLDVAASGGYYLACASDRIIAHPTTITGSIGVIMVAPDFSGTMAKIGARANIIKSGPLKDAGSPFREMSSGDRAYFQKLIDEMYERFLAVVAAGRPGLRPETLRAIADGRVYLAGEALSNGLVDAIGSLDDAVAAAREAGGLGSRPVVVVQYARPAEWRPNYYAAAPGQPATQINLVNVELPEWLNGGQPQFLYLWLP